LQLQQWQQQYCKQQQQPKKTAVAAVLPAEGSAVTAALPAVEAPPAVASMQEDIASGAERYLVLQKACKQQLQQIQRLQQLSF
jgi:hypothetical protein